MKKFFTALLVLALVGCATSPTPTGDEEILRTSNLARIAFEDGAILKAITLYERALNRARATDDTTEVGNTAYNLALCHILLEQYDQATQALSEARAAFKRKGQTPLDLLLLEATLARRQGKWELALSLADRILQLSPDADHRFQTMLLKGMVASEQGDVTRARVALSKSEKIPLANPALLAAQERLAANIFLLEKKPSEAALAFERAANLFQKSKRYRDMALELRRAGESYRDAGDTERAEDLLLRAQRSLAAQGEKP